MIKTAKENYRIAETVSIAKRIEKQKLLSEKYANVFQSIDQAAAKGHFYVEVAVHRENEEELRAFLAYNGYTMPIHPALNTINLRSIYWRLK